MRPGDQDGKAETLPDHAPDHFDRRRAEGNVRRQAQFFEEADEVGPARLHVQQNHRFQAQITQRHLLELGEAMVRWQQRVRSLRRHQGFGLNGGVEVVFVQDCQVEGARGQALHQLLLLAVADADFYPRV
jgi:hypothetical protein